MFRSLEYRNLGPLRGAILRMRMSLRSHEVLLSAVIVCNSVSDPALDKPLSLDVWRFSIYKSCRSCQLLALVWQTVYSRRNKRL